MLLIGAGQSRTSRDGSKQMTKQQMISLGVLALVAEGFDPVEALKMICGADKVDQMISDLYLQLRGEA